MNLTNQSKEKPSKDDSIQIVQKTLKKNKTHGRKSFYKMSSSNRRKIKAKLKNTIVDMFGYLKQLGLGISKVDILPIEMVDEQFCLNIMKQEEAENTRSPNTNTMLFYKDKYSISDKCFHDLKVCLPFLVNF
jgi:hypothetical protein